MGARWCWLVMCAAALAPPALGEPSHASWRTYRSEKFGYQLSYPPEVELRAYFDGQSADLRDARTGNSVADIEVWPPDECPRQPPGVTARALGIERATMATQADGPDGSSSCGDPVTVRERNSGPGAPLFELALTCTSERFDDAGKAIRTPEGHKDPTFFVDVSRPWRVRVLAIDPSGIDPRLPSRTRADPDLVRKVAETVATFPTEDPHTVCIEDVRPGAITTPARAAPPR